MTIAMVLEDEAQVRVSQAAWVRAQLEGAAHTRDELGDVLGMSSQEVREALELLHESQVPIREVQGMYYIQIGESG